MATKRSVTISWSGGKDSAFALYKTLLSGEYEVVHLHTLIGEETRRVGLHGVPEALIDAQAAELQIPLKKLYLPSSDDHAAYETVMKAFYKTAVREGIEAVVFGDIFLEDLKAYRERLLAPFKLDTYYPLWQVNSRQLIDDFINIGFKTLLCSANTRWFQPAALGKTIDESFVQHLPAEVDPCGENGEFHTFVYDGPVFRRPVSYTLGEVVEKKYHFQRLTERGETVADEASFWFQDIQPAG